ncbi:cryptochrome/photolyase family protein [Actinoplanes teichomyceticus]|uniref:Deoxyribodipyrimidine photo-lyase n=1 Tax=Actinoplanes teichomyceticus TaxID=1867 RepID=A0A561WRW0_ACTTI|nr:deoxyribodipyrimidine photo-lyase [Actinoplanes teichomyceticus]TWG26605.1 deoxyribodipyrimidine photo-lyase [Actinoplanes teichomyceticus]GIF16912.1 deoxyribodipyrimidine photo-lyase [Actinoplanes teichomyceticus]
MGPRIALLTRDLRIHDNPLFAGPDPVVPLFVLDPRLGGLSANRQRFLHQSLADLRGTLRARGADLVVRHGDPVAEAIRLAGRTGASTIAVAGDVTAYAQRRERRLRAETVRHRIQLEITPGVTVLPPGAVRPGGGASSYRVFTPYFKAWANAGWRGLTATPANLAMPAGIAPGDLPATPAGESPDAVPGGETEGRRRLCAWLGQISRYDDDHDDMAADNTSRLSAYLRFGCLSALEVALAARADDSPGAQAYLRQLAWRDFYYQVTAAFPRLSTQPLRPAADRDWRYDDDALRHWQDGLTGVPIVDAGMRQLRAEGWMHNRARLITAAFLTKHLGIDWRPGLQWFFRWLVDGDVPNNSGNWQWTAGTGNDTRPYRRFNPVRQAQRFDAQGVYVRRYVPELKGVDGPAVHQPWRLPDAVRRGLDYPGPLESHRDEAVWLRA